MENEKKIKVALIRGNSLNQWEGALWNNLSGEINVTGFCSKQNLYPLGGLQFPIKKLANSADFFLARQYDKFANGRFQMMAGLENNLQSFDIAHTAEISYFFTNQAVRAKKLNPKLKVVTTVWDNSFGRFEFNYWPFFKSSPAWWRSKTTNNIAENVQGVDLFLPITEYSAELLLDYGVPAEKIKILTPAVVMPEKNVDIQKFLDQYDLKNRPFYMAVQRMVKEKGVYDILYAWKMYLRRHQPTNAVLLMIGKGPEEANISRLVSEWELEKFVFLVENMPNEQIRALYGYARALILASLPGPVWQEQFGYVLAEAIINDCPVISTYSGAIPEVIENAGLLFSPGNPVELKNCLIKLSDVAVVRELRANCEKVKSKFAVDNFVNKLSAIYKSLLISG